ncbi:MAG: hypothetical protein M1562_01630 [Candidatus Marsarchaeota archaeon]|jgi:hypothetical protein|nr:hypothetical protein [Candidatus Marsarchaeota archaeon]
MTLHLRLYEIYNTIKLGWDRTSFLFYIGTPAALISKFFGYVGGIAVALTVLFLYAAGRFHTRYEINKSKRLGDKRKGARANSKRRGKRKKRKIIVSIW